MKLSEPTVKIENDFQKEREETVKKVIEKLQECLGVNLYEAAKTDNPITTFNNLSFFLLDKFKDVLYYSLEASNIETRIFEREALVSFILGVTRNRNNTEFLKELLMRRGIIGEYKEDQNNIIMSTILGPIRFKKAEEVINEETKTFVENNVDIMSACHESTLFLLEKNPSFFAVTSIARKNLGGKYFHSFILDGDYVLDLTGNLYMNKEDYYRLYGIEEIRNVNYEQFLKDSKECEHFDESRTMFPLFRNAMYWYLKEKNIHK